MESRSYGTSLCISAFMACRTSSGLNFAPPEGFEVNWVEASHFVGRITSVAISCMCTAEVWRSSSTSTGASFPMLCIRGAAEF